MLPPLVRAQIVVNARDARRVQAVRKRVLRLRHARRFCDVVGVVRDGAVCVDCEAKGQAKHSTGMMQEKEPKARPKICSL